MEYIIARRWVNGLIFTFFIMKITIKSEKDGNFVPQSNPKKTMLVIESKKKKLETLKKEYPDAMIIDVTSHAEDDFIKFSPFYPHTGIPVPFSPGKTAASVEGIWQGLKVFEDAGVDRKMFSIRDMKNIKRTTRKYGPCLGHQKGLESRELLGYIEARKQIYLPAYKWVLENKLQDLVKALRIISKNKTVVLLDYETNDNVNNPNKALSHASLIKAYIEGNYPE